MSRAKTTDCQRNDGVNYKIAHFYPYPLPAYPPGFPEVPALLARLHANGLKLVVASSAEQEELGKLLEIAGATPFVQEETSSDDAENSKPDPDIVQVNLAKTGYSPDEVIMWGDTPYDIEAARRVGVATVALRCGGWIDPDLKDALAIYNDPADLLAHYHLSPLACVNGDNKR